MTAEEKEKMFVIFYKMNKQQKALVEIKAERIVVRTSNNHLHKSK